MRNYIFKRIKMVDMDELYLCLFSSLVSKRVDGYVENMKSRIHTAVGVERVCFSQQYTNTCRFD